MRATFAIVLLAVIGRLGLAQQDGDDVLPSSVGGYGRYRGYKGYHAPVGKFADSPISRGK
jgi:hypothetical protein